MTNDENMDMMARAIAELEKRVAFLELYVYEKIEEEKRKAFAQMYFHSFNPCAPIMPARYLTEPYPERGIDKKESEAGENAK